MGEDVKGFVAGWFAGSAGLVASHPLDTIRIRMQTQGNLYSSSMQCFREIISKEKVKGLFKGITYPLLGQAAINATVFGVQSFVYRRLKNESGQPLNVWNSLVAGACAGAVQTIVVCPVELVKIRMQNQSIGTQHVSWAMAKMGRSSARNSKGYKGPLDMTWEIIRRNGLKGMYQGWWLSQLREVPQFAIYFGSYTWIRLKMAALNSKTPQDLSLWELSLAGGMAGVLTWSWYPVDVIKSRFQDDGKKQYNGILDCLRKSVKAEGMGILVKGLQPTLVRGFFNGFATFPVFTLTMRLLNSEHH